MNTKKIKEKIMERFPKGKQLRFTRTEISHRVRFALEELKNEKRK